MQQQIKVYLESIINEKMACDVAAKPLTFLPFFKCQVPVPVSEFHWSWKFSIFSSLMSSVLKYMLDIAESMWQGQHFMLPRNILLLLKELGKSVFHLHHEFESTMILYISCKTTERTAVISKITVESWCLKAAVGFEWVIANWWHYA